MKFLSLSLDVRHQWASKWSAEFAPRLIEAVSTNGQARLADGTVQAQLVDCAGQARLCLDIITRVWGDVYGAWGRQGRGPHEWWPQRLRYLPDSLGRVLQRWAQQEISLVLFDRVPAVEEVLAFQAQGKRVVSLLLQETEIRSFQHEGRDFMGLLIHDLIHADHFFLRGPENLRWQRAFFRWAHQQWGGDLGRRMSESSYRGAFEYLFSDMNTHPWHLVKTLKSLGEQAGLDAEIAQQLPDRVSSQWPSINSPSENQSLIREVLENWGAVDSLGDLSPVK